MTSTNNKRKMETSDFNLEKIKVQRADNRDEMLSCVMEAIIDLQNSGKVTSDDLQRRIILIGATSSGKSSVCNGIVSCLTGEKCYMCPTSGEVCTKKILGISCTAQPPFEGAMECVTADGAKLKANNFDAVRAYLSTTGEGIKTVSLDMANKNRVQIKAKHSLILYDVPGFLSDMAKAPWLSLMSSADGHSFPIILTPTSGALNKGNFQIDTQITVTLDELRNNSDKYKGTRYFIVMTHMDCVIQNGQIDTLVASANIIVNSCPGRDIQIVLTQLVDPDSNAYDGSSEAIRRKEIETFGKIRALADAKRDDGSPLFVLGIEALTKTLISEVRAHLANDVELLRTLETVLTEKIEISQEQLNVISQHRTGAEVGTILRMKLLEYRVSAKNRIRLGGKLAVKLRSICDSYYPKSKLRASHAPEKPNLSGAVAAPKLLKSVDSLMDWQACMEDFMKCILSQGDNLADMMMAHLLEGLEPAFSPYIVCEKFYREALIRFMRDYVRIHDDEFKVAVRQSIALQMGVIEKTEISAKKVSKAWPQQSLFLKESKLGEKTSNRIREVLIVLDPLIDAVENGLLTIYAAHYYNGFANGLGDHLSTMKEPLETPDGVTDKSLHERVLSYQRSLGYVSHFIREATPAVIAEPGDQKMEEAPKTPDGVIGKIFGMFQRKI